MSYAVNVMPEAWASVIHLPPDVVDCVERCVMALSEDPADLANPSTDPAVLQTPQPDVLQYDFQCEPWFFSALFLIDDPAGVVRVGYIHQHRDRR